MKERFGLLGLPYDSTTSLGWPGARYAPARIREALRWIRNRIVDNRIFDVESGRVLDLSRLELKDFGDAQISRFDHEASLAQLQAAIDAVFEAGFVPILLGGDHCVSWPGLQSLHSHRTGAVGIIHLDAHLDLLEGSEIQGRHSGSSEIRRALELPQISGRNVVQIGVRGFNYPEHHDFIRQAGITLIPPAELFTEGVQAVARKALRIAGEGTSHIYLTVDIDVLDSAFAPGSGANEPGGISSWQLLHFVRLVAPEVDAMDIVEVNPLTDYRDMTSAVAARLVFDFLAANAAKL
jgi:formiminoglutamase/agmatinase